MEQDHVVQEVHDELHWDRVWGWIRSYRYALIGSFVALVVGILGWEFYKDRQVAKKQLWTSAYLRILDDARQKKLGEALERVESLQQQSSKEQEAFLSILRMRLLWDRAHISKQGTPPFGCVGIVS